MTLKVVFRRAARDEFDAAAFWYEDRQLGLGAQFVPEIDHAVMLASANPNTFPIKHGDIRCVRVRRFPYSVYFRSEGNRIVVFAIFHARRDPMTWQSRL